MANEDDEIDLLSRTTAERGVGTIRHYLYAPTESAARKAELLLGQHILEPAEIRPAAMGDNWLVIVLQKGVLSRDSISTARLVLEDIALQINGEYDGWETDLDTSYSH